MRKKSWLIFVIIVLLISFTSCTKTIRITFGGNVKDSTAESSSLYPAYKLEKDQQLWGYINENGKFIIEPQFEYAENFQPDGIARILKDDMYGLINLKGEIIAEPVYTIIDDFTEGYTIANKKWEQYFILDKKGKVIYQTADQINYIKDGMVCFGVKIAEWKYMYGYMDINGNVIIEPQYTNAGQFTDGKAVVGLEEGKYAIIGKEGNIELQFDSYYTPQISEGIIVFSTNYGNYDIRYGYMNIDGTMLTDEMFYFADVFNNGVAIVQMDEAGDYEYKLINKAGKFVIEESNISYINRIGDKYLSVSKGSDLYLGYIDTMYSKNAIFDLEGKQLTDYSYYNVSSITEELISVCDDTSTFIIDGNGKAAAKYPKLNGIGYISSVGRLIKADIDGDLIYLNKDGKIVWQSDNTMALGDGVTVEYHKYRPDRFMYIRYPEIKGLKNQKVQKQLNDEIKDAFIGDSSQSEKDEDMYTADINIYSSVEKNKDILVIFRMDSYYPLGAAHGSGFMSHYHYNINNGKSYKLSDLFKKDSSYTEVLTDIISQKISEENEEDLSYYYAEIEIGEEQGFAVNKDYLKIYFQQYEIAPYAAGFPSFEIHYGDILDIIDTEGEFWNSFEKNIITSEGHSAQQNKMTADIKNKISALIDDYENKIIEAINNNSFELVEPTLLKGSDLYESQEKLVASLYNKGVKETLEYFTVKNIEQYKDEYRVYVEEAIVIQQQGKESQTKYFDWIYTASYEKASDSYKLSNIEKWSK